MAIDLVLIISFGRHVKPAGFVSVINLLCILSVKDLFVVNLNLTISSLLYGVFLPNNLFLVLVLFLFALGL
jgi:hypothetical protein